MTGAANAAVGAGACLQNRRNALAAGDIERWDLLAQRATEPNPFFERWFLQPALEAHDPGKRARLMVLEEGGEWLGLMPLSLDRHYYRRPLPQYCTWLHGNCFLGMPLVARGHEEKFWRALLGWADREAGIGLFLHLSQLPLDSRNCDALRAVLTAQGRTSALVMKEERAMLASDMTREKYLEASLSGKKRKELRRQHNRLAEMGNLTFHHQTDETGLAEWIEAFLALESAGWKGERGSAMASAPETAGLFQKALSAAAARGKLERRTISLDDQPIAMLASFLCPPGSFSFKTAYDERYSRFSPGVLLQCENLALLDQPEISWCDSCAAADHPMIDHIWRERRPIGRVSIAIGGGLRRNLFKLIARLELGRNPDGIPA